MLRRQNGSPLLGAREGMAFPAVEKWTLQMEKRGRIKLEILEDLHCVSMEGRTGLCVVCLCAPVALGECVCSCTCLHVFVLVRGQP